ncbi:MAG TPA: diaminopimelate epimerase [Rhodospirillaceae bacterium]|jgi:diaminopimelate epimerase|nr:diaminopimelate epimerase [Rhodospirillaceae bacterium]HBT44104.1 diaminopimelate epimerase [Rhodospirillaceae bacterium]HCS70702.1 diaminopimelate epimerase [Rhodospirillaceae bacterium]|tara:strand:+ start:4965 stop:5819 length:855 start_codon:yes stop_codon:yes gene_type:complete
MEQVPFIKMHGLGNDFVVLDARETPMPLTAGQAAAIADRRRGVGCDQLIVLERPRSDIADVFVRFHNSDGGESLACGNGTRCIAAMLMDEKSSDHLIVETGAGLLDAEKGKDGLVTVDMGTARLDWREIPLSEAVDTLHVDAGAGPLQDAVCVSMGNPHAVYFVDDADAVPIEVFGPVIEQHKMFPQFTNVEAASLRPDGAIRMRVWERGAGVTQACGTGACATLVAAVRRGLIAGRKADVIVDGGTLTIEWLPDDHVLLTGPVATSFTGTLDPRLLNGAATGG